MIKISIVIGIYNSEKTIEKVINEITDVFDKQQKYCYEIILVNDNSPDNVYSILKKLAVYNSYIKVINLTKNAGQTNAVIEGYRYATGDYVVEMDDDYQMPAYGIIALVDALIDGDYDVAFAKYPQQKESTFRRFGSWVNSLMTKKMMDRPKDIDINSFFAMRKNIAEGITKYTNNYPYLYGIIFSITKNATNVEIQHRERLYGKSNYTFKNLFGLWLNGFLNFSIEPLRFATKLGLIITVVSFIIAIYLVIQRIVGGTLAIGWTSIMVTIILFSGVQLTVIGLLGEYIGKMFISNSGLPRATIKETINCEKTERKEAE